MIEEKQRFEVGEWVHRPLVDSDPDLQPFWDGLKEHRFLLCRCKRCGSWWFPYTVCNLHDDIPEFEEMEWTDASGAGAVFAKIVVYQVDDPAFADEVPYPLAIVELDEGPHFPARIVGCAPEEVVVGGRVAVDYFDSGPAGHTLPLFRLVR